MTKAGNSKPIVLNTLLLMALIVAWISPTGYCQAQEGYSLMIQQSPVDGGRVEPGAGVHRTELNETVTIKAIPSPGYDFICWVGDVSDITTRETTIFVNAPKMVIAIFERSEFELEAVDVINNGPGVGGLRRTINPITGASGVSPGRGALPPPIPPDQDFPVPENNEFPVPEDAPIPEPATIFFLGAGAWALTRKRTKKPNT